MDKWTAGSIPGTALATDFKRRFIKRMQRQGKTLKQAQSAFKTIYGRR